MSVLDYCDDELIGLTKKIQDGNDDLESIMKGHMQRAAVNIEDDDRQEKHDEAIGCSIMKRKIQKADVNTDATTEDRQENQDEAMGKIDQCSCSCSREVKDLVLQMSSEMGLMQEKIDDIKRILLLLAVEDKALQHGQHGQQSTVISIQSNPNAPPSSKVQPNIEDSCALGKENNRGPPDPSRITTTTKKKKAWLKPVKPGPARAAKFRLAAEAEKHNAEKEKRRQQDERKLFCLNILEIYDRSCAINWEAYQATPAYQAVHGGRQGQAEVMLLADATEGPSGTVDPHKDRE